MTGFLPFSRASFMLDVVALSMIVVLPIMGWSIYLVKFRKNYKLHKTLQLALGGLLLITVLLFEIDVRVNGWRQYAKESPFYDTWLFPVLYVHLVFAVSTTLLWIVTIFGALRRFKPPTRPNAYSPHHKRLARIAAVDMCLTAVTGWTFYWMAFVA